MIESVMREALQLAASAAQHGDVPVGAVVLDRQGNIISRGANRRERLGDPFAHAEIIAMRQAAQVSSGGWNLYGTTLVVTLEPCPMCAGAALAAHVGRIVFGAWDAKLGACGSVWDVPRDPHVGESPEVIGGIMERECARLLGDFFDSRRRSR